MQNDTVHLLSIESDDIAVLPFDIRAANKWRIFTERLSSPAQYVKFFRLAQIIHIAGVHVHCVHQPGALRGPQMFLKSLDGDSFVRFKRQERRRDSSTLRRVCCRSMIDSIFIVLPLRLSTVPQQGALVVAVQWIAT